MDSPRATTLSNAPSESPSRLQYTSRPESPAGSISNCNEKHHLHKFKSYRLVGEYGGPFGYTSNLYLLLLITFQRHRYEQPWRGDKRMRVTRYNGWVIWGLVLVSAILSAYYCFAAYSSVPKHQYCLVLDDDFSTLDTSVWSYEVQLDGFGVGSFDWTTTDSLNTFVDSEGLHILPTLTNETTAITNAQILNGYALNLTADGTCTGTTNASCAAFSNSSTGTIIPPVRSARLTTSGTKTIKYGRVEVVAKLPAGDWLWPAIWMMPQDSVYGAWPRSGEIDIMESRGNPPSYPNDGDDFVSSSLHWGPTSDQDAYWRTTGSNSLKQSDFTDRFHTFGLEWSENYIYTWLDSPLRQTLYLTFPKDGLWQLGNFGNIIENNTLLTDPWNTTDISAPFDQEFYLILDVAVGSLNGYFPDSVGGKPWVDATGTIAASEFWLAADQWLPTWGKGNDRSMSIKSVKMWQQGECA